VKAVISTPGQKLNYTFAGTANKHVTFQVTQFNFSNGTSGGEVVLDFYKPGSSSVYTSCAFTGDDFCDFTPPLTGTWKVKLVPVSASVGSLTLTFANDVATQALASATPVNTTIKFEGQHAGYTFAGTANKHVTFQVTQFNFSNGTSGGEVVLDFYKPGSSSVYTSCAFTGDDFCDFTPPLTGTWKVKLVPVSASVGSLTLTFANDVATQALASATPVNTTIKFEGQHAGYTFAGTTGTARTFTVTQFNFSNGGSGGEVVLDFYEPGSSSVYTSCAFTGDDFCDFTPPVTGTWSAELVPVSDSVGNLTLTLT
jgi:hypothetical protein